MEKPYSVEKGECMRNAAIAIVAALMLLPGFLPGSSEAQASQEAFTFDEYHGYAEIKAEMERLAATFPEITDLMTLGKTWEGRDILAMRVTDNPELEEADEPDILIMGGHHARELPSVEVPVFIMSHILSNYATDSGIRDLVDANDIWFVPLVNPDGREYALGTDPAWRKNRRPIDANGDGTVDGTGVDLNRNYGHLWGQEGVSTDPQSSIYCGPSAFSENETMAIKTLAETVGFSVSLSYHTYGQVIYYPWNNGIDTASPRGHILEAIAEDIGHLTGYTPMQGIDAYPTTGDSDDWLYADAGCLPFTVELGSQFVPPPDQLESLCLRNLGAALHVIGLAAEPERALLPEWCVMTYMSADADIALANEALVDINEMEAAGNSSDVNIIVLYDGRATGDSRIYEIASDPGGFNSMIISPTVDDQGAIIDPVSGEADMSDPAVLRGFVNWTMANYPAQRYMLVFWGHGDGIIQGFVPDKGSAMQVSEIGPALAGFNIDIVGFDTCSMGHFEVAAELLGIAEIMIGSEAEEPISGWDYRTSLGKLAQKPWMNPRELATAIVSDYLAANTAGYVTQAAIDLKVFGEKLLPALENFVDVSLDFAYKDHSRIWSARNATSTFVDERDAVDLFEFLDNLCGMAISDPVLKRATGILETENELMIHSGTGTSFPGARTMAVHFPMLAIPISPAYSGLRFLDSGWGDYLDAAKRPEKRPFVTSTTPPLVNTTSHFQVTAQITDGPEFPDVMVVYRVNGGPWRINTMGAANGSLESDPLPGQPNGTFIEYFFDFNNITEPYEVKWGEAKFLNITVFAFCDVSVQWAEVPSFPGLWEGNLTTYRLNVSNSGPETVEANITLEANGTAGHVLIGWQTVFLAQGQHATVEFNWIAVAGNWTITAYARQETVFDTNRANEEVGASVFVGPLANNGSGGISYLGPVLALAIMWSVSLLAIVIILRKGRTRRTREAARALTAARNFVRSAGELGANTELANTMLDNAEAAFRRGALPECESLVRKARENAIDAVREAVSGQ